MTDREKVPTDLLKESDRCSSAEVSPVHVAAIVEEPARTPTLRTSHMQWPDPYAVCHPGGAQCRPCAPGSAHPPAGRPQGNPMSTLDRIARLAQAQRTITVHTRNTLGGRAWQDPGPRPDQPTRRVADRERGGRTPNLVPVTRGSASCPLLADHRPSVITMRSSATATLRTATLRQNVENKLRPPTCRQPGTTRA